MHAQFVPPRIKNYIRRARLQELGFSILSHRITTVTAPAGYGKSVWISSLLKEPGWPATAWLSLDRQDSEPSFLLYHLIHAVKRALPGFGSQALRTMNSLEDAGRDWRIAVSSFLEEIPGESEIVLVLDDFHLIEKNAAIPSILEFLTRWLPGGVHLVLTSRNSLPVNLCKERLSGELLEIQSDKLLFSVEESRELFSLFGLQLAEKEVTEIHFSTEGWPAGLRLLGMLLKRSGGGLKKTQSALKSKDADLYTYLSNELLEYLPGELQNFLLESSLLPYLEPELCNAALWCGDSDLKIKQLHAQGLLSRSEGETTTWRLHHLMGEFMEQKVTQLRPPEYVVSVRSRAAAFLENIGDIDRALEQVAACSDWAAAINLIHRHGDEYFMRRGRQDTLNSWIGRLPEELVNGDHRLLFFKGMSIMHISLEEALDDLSRAAVIGEQKGDIKCRFRSLLTMATIYGFVNNTQKLKETAEQMAAAAALSRSPWLQNVVLVAGMGSAVWEDDLQKATQLSAMVDKTALDSETRMKYAFGTSALLYRLGNLKAALEDITGLLEDPYVRENECWTGTALAVYAFICMMDGGHDKLPEILKEMLRLGQKYNVPYQIALAFRHQAHLNLLAGQLSEAREKFELSRSAFLQYKDIYVALLTELDLVLLRMYSGEEARDLLPEALNIWEKMKDMPGGQGMDEYAQSVVGTIAMESGQLNLARLNYEEVSLKCSQKGARHVLAGTQLCLARLHLLQGDNDTADSYLRKALGAAETEKWEYFWHWHPETVYTLCRRALLKKIHPKWAAHLLRRWFPERVCQEACGLLNHPDESVRNGIFTLLQNMLQKTGVPVVHVNCLGVFRIFVNGVEITSSRWKTKKAENLAKFLITERRQHLKEIIIEELWPESDPRLGDANLRKALSHARKALGIINCGSESLILERGLVYLNPIIEIHTDYELFDAVAKTALAYNDMDNPVMVSLLEQAAGLYQGDFLPDNLYDDWTAGLRGQLRQLCLQVLLKLVECCRRQGRLSPAIKTCFRYLALEPADEPVNRTAMELLWQTGQKQRALDLYHDLSAILAKEYGIVPAAETNSLYEKIRRG
jgi:ATP/maltotriose-dependent transcriptional regulator MalT/DNA-binding SARP family transcriptional activator